MTCERESLIKQGLKIFCLVPQKFWENSCRAPKPHPHHDTIPTAIPRHKHSTQHHFTPTPTDPRKGCHTPANPFPTRLPALLHTEGVSHKQPSHKPSVTQTHYAHTRIKAHTELLPHTEYSYTYPSLHSKGKLSSWNHYKYHTFMPTRHELHTSTQQNYFYTTVTIHVPFVRTCEPQRTCQRWHIIDGYVRAMALGERT